MASFVENVNKAALLDTDSLALVITNISLLTDIATQVVPNIDEILLVNNNAIVVTTKASEASVSAITATTQAGIAITQAGIATTNALEASTSADTATTQAGLASIAKTQAEAYSATCLAIANFDFAGFTVVDGELIVSMNDLGASTASLVDGELILTY